MKTLPAAGLTILLMIYPVASIAGVPEVQVRATIDRVLAIVKDPQLKSRESERRQKLKEALHQRFDFTEMAKRSLGPDWRRLSPAQQQEFVELFTDLLEQAYLDRIEAYASEKIEYLKERQDNEFAEVDTKIIDQKGREFSLDYRLHNVKGDWKVYDVLVDDVSLVNNYRAQFTRVLAKSSVDELLQRMKEKAFSAPAAKG